MGRRSREQEQIRQQRRRSKARSSQRFLNNGRISDEKTLREILKEEGIYVGGALADAVSRFLDDMCRDHRREQAEQELANITVARTGLLTRLESSEEPPEVPQNPRSHEPLKDWGPLSEEQEDYKWDELMERLEAEENEDPNPETGKSRRVGRCDRLDEIEGVRRPVPPEVSDEPRK